MIFVNTSLPGDSNLQIFRTYYIVKNTCRGVTVVTYRRNGKNFLPARTKPKPGLTRPQGFLDLVKVRCSTFLFLRFTLEWFLTDIVWKA